MSRTYKHTNGDKKIFRGKILAELDYSYHEDGRRIRKLKNGVIDNNTEYYISLMNGNFGSGVPKAFRKNLVRSQRNRLKQELNNATSKDSFDKVGEVIDKRNAGWLYY